MAKTKINTAVASEPLPNVVLTEKEGSKVVGVLKRKFESKTYPGSFSYLIHVEDTNAPTRLFDRDTETVQDVELAAGDLAWLKGSSVLNRALEQINDGEKIEIVYTGKGEKKKGRKAPYLFDVFRVED